MKGTYILAINIPEKRNINIGALGTIPFKKGFYFYIGSAMGATGSSTLLNRVKRHLKPPINKKIHWHIDYLLNDKYSRIIRIFLIPSMLKLECIIAEELSDLSEGIIKDFGCSDCKCLSHLLYFKNFSSLKEIYKKGLTL